MRNKSSGGFSVGTSSILVIFILLCLVTFAALSYITARADFSFTSRSANAVLEYYAADSAAAAKLAEIDKVLESTALQTENKTDYNDTLIKHYENDKSVSLDLQGDKLYITFSSPVNDKLTLVCTITAEYPMNSGGYYTVKSWQTRDTALWQPDDRLPVYQGDSSAQSADDDGENLSTGALPSA